MKSKKKIIVIAVAIVVVLVVVIGAIAGASNGSAGYPVTTANVVREDISSEIEVSGLVVSEETKTYFSPVTGMVSSMNAVAGEEVKKGDVLLTYDLEDMQRTSEENALRAQAEKYGIDATVATLQKEQSDYSKAVKGYDDAMAFVVHWSACLESASRDYNEAMSIASAYDALKAQVDGYKIQQAENEVPNEALAQMITEGEAQLAELEQKKAQYDYATLESTVQTCSKELNEYKALAEQYKAQKIENPALASQSKQQAVLKEINEMEKENADKELTKAAEGICADFSGIISDVSVVEGQTLAEGTQLFTLQSVDKLKVSVAVTKYDLQQIAVGQKAQITINGSTYDGTVTKLSKIAGTNSNGAATVDVDVHIDNPDDQIFIGIEGKVKIQCGTVKDACVLPFSCVNYDTKGAFCYVVEDGIVTRKDVVTGMSSDEKIEIVSGVTDEDVVISEVTSDIVEGMEVMVLEDSNNATE